MRPDRVRAPFEVAGIMRLVAPPRGRPVGPTGRVPCPTIVPATVDHLLLLDGADRGLRDQRLAPLQLRRVSGSRVTSLDVYTAVFQGSVRTREDFDEWVTSRRRASATPPGAACGGVR